MHDFVQKHLQYVVVEDFVVDFFVFKGDENRIEQDFYDNLPNSSYVGNSAFS